MASIGSISGWTTASDPFVKASILDLAFQLQKEGFNLLLFDFRGHGDSDRPQRHHHGHGHEKAVIDEAPLSMLLPLVIVALCLIVIGLYSGDIVTNIIQHSVPTGLL